MRNHLRSPQVSYEIADIDDPVAFHLRVESVLHLGERFALEMLVPAVISAQVEGNQARAEAFGQHFTDAAQVILLWDLLDLDAIYEEGEQGV